MFAETKTIGTRADGVRLFLLGFLGLFLELALIRYLAGNIWNLGYFPNLVLIATFVGMGTGFVLYRRVPARWAQALFQAGLVVLLVLAGFVTFAHPTVPGFERFAGDVGGELFFTGAREGTGRWDRPAFVLWFGAVVTIFALLSQWTARVFERFQPLAAYTLDIGGSCVGILAFMAVSWAELPAWSWFLLLIPVVQGAMPAARLTRVLPVLVLGAVGGLAWHQDQALLIKPELEPAVVRWSPYQKVEMVGPPKAEPTIFVNGILHQALFDEQQIAQSFYDIPHAFRKSLKRPPYRSVLVIGAGSGNDTAAALARGAEHIDAVEIDPVIARLGLERHPTRVYEDERVNVVNDDARAFLNRTTRRYDLIVFALTDSLVKVSPMAQLRLENYLFTEQAIAKAYSLLTEEGDLVFYNYYRQPWLPVKIEETIRRATGVGAVPVAKTQGLWIIMAGPRTRLDSEPTPEREAMATATDDWPFLYLKDRAIPTIYLWAMAGLSVFVTLMLLVLRSFPARGQESVEASKGRLGLKVAFLFMGLAFLLLETKGVIQFSLLFGTTWVNNSLVFLGALVLVLAANLVAWRVGSDRLLPAAFLLLLLSCLVILVYPLQNLLGVESWWLRFALASLMTFSPIFFANLIFSVTFRDQPLPADLFGYNLLGATLGGVVEYTSMLLGYNALAGIVALSYTIVYVLIRRARPTPAPAGLEALTGPNPAP